MPSSLSLLKTHCYTGLRRLSGLSSSLLDCCFLGAFFHLPVNVEGSVFGPLFCPSTHSLWVIHLSVDSTPFAGESQPLTYRCDAPSNMPLPFGQSHLDDPHHLKLTRQNGMRHCPQKVCVPFHAPPWWSALSHPNWGLFPISASCFSPPVLNRAPSPAPPLRGNSELLHEEPRSPGGPSLVSHGSLSPIHPTPCHALLAPGPPGGSTLATQTAAQLQETGFNYLGLYFTCMKWK